jgi:hypothetical protein
MLAIACGRRIMAMGLIKFMTSAAIAAAPRARADKSPRAGSAAAFSRSPMPGSMFVPRPVLRIAWFGFLGALEQTLRGADAENDADDGADREIQQSGIEQSLKGVTHLQSLPSLAPRLDQTRAPSDGADHATVAAGCRTAIGPRTNPLRDDAPASEWTATGKITARTIGPSAAGHLWKLRKVPRFARMRGSMRHRGLRRHGGGEQDRRCRSNGNQSSHRFLLALCRP